MTTEFQWTQQRRKRAKAHDFGSAQSTDPEVAAKEQAVYDRLVTARMMIWRKAGGKFPAYRVATNKALWHLARWRPDSPQSLADIPGLGPASIVRYGPDLWQALVSACVAAEIYQRPVPPMMRGAPAPKNAIAAWALMDERTPLAEIAGTLGRKLTTVLDYWYHWILRTQPSDLTPWITPDRQVQIERAIVADRLDSGGFSAFNVAVRLAGRPGNEVTSELVQQVRCVNVAPKIGGGGCSVVWSQ